MNLPETTRNMPATDGPFVGRARQVEQLYQAAANAPLVVVHGPPGVGKTRLVAQLANQSGPGSVAWLSLTSARNLDDLSTEACAALGVEAPGDESSRASLRRVGAALEAAEFDMVVFDDFDSLADLADSWLRARVNKAGPLLVVTCRRRLEIPGAAYVDVAPLELHDAVLAFEAHATQVRPNFDIEAHRSSVARLVDALDRLPFAIELAARRIRLMTPEQITERLDQRFALLRRRRSGRTEAMELALDWTWQLLEPAERRLLQQLCVLDGAVELSAIEAIASPDDAFGWIDLLDQIVAKAWLQSQPQEHAEVRFRMLETVRAFVRRQEDSSGARADGERRAAEHFSQLADELAEQLRTSQGVAALDRMENNQRHFVAAANYWIDQRDVRAAGVIDALGELALMRGPLFRWRALLELALPIVAERGTESQRARLLELRARMALLAGQRVEAVDFTSRMLDTVGRLDAADAARVLRTAGMVESATQPRRGRELLTRALEKAEQAGDAFTRARVLERQGFSRLRLFELVGAEEALQASHRLLGRGRHPLYEADSLAGLAYVAHRQNRLEQAIEIFERVVSVHRGNAAHAPAASALFNLGVSLHIVGRLEEAEARLREALGEWERMGMRYYGAVGSTRLALVLFEAGRVDECDQRLAHASQTAQEVGDAQNAAMADGFLGLTRWLAGRGSNPAQMEEARARLHAGSDPDAAAAFSVAALGMSKEGEGGRLADLNRIEELAALLSPQDHYLEEVVGRLLELGRGFHAVGKLDGVVDTTTRRKLAGEAAQTLFEVVQPRDNAALMGEIARLHNPFVRLLAARLANELRGHGVEIGRGAAHADHVLEVHSNCHWFRIDGGEPVELSVKKSSRLIVKAIVQKHFDDPDGGVNIEELIELAWPDEQLTFSSGRNRVYTTIKALRDDGLEPIIETSSAGYRIAKDVEVRVAPTTGIRVS